MGEARVGRRRFLVASGGVVVAAAAGVAGYEYRRHSVSTPTTTSVITSTPAVAATGPYVTRPDLNPTPVTFTKEEAWVVSASEKGDFYVVAPKAYAADAAGQSGLMLIDGDGKIAWFHPGVQGLVLSDLQVQAYQSQPVLTWWEGKGVAGHGQGYGYVVDDQYRQIAKISAGNGLLADSHELNLTPAGTALITAFGTKTVDLTSVGGPRKGVIYYCEAQEIDVATGKLLFSWDSSEHVAIDESYSPFDGGTSDKPYDFFHMNSVALMPDGDLLISARNTWAIYKVSRRTGDIVWRMNGKKSDFAMGPGTNYYWQHHARALGAGQITLFDDGASPPEEISSRGLILNYDESAMTCNLAQAYVHPSKLRAANQGSMQVLSDGRVVVGWGNQPYFSEFDQNGTMIVDARFAPDVQTYRAFRSPWVGAPAARPDVVAKIFTASVTVYVSWNGDTRTRQWRILAGGAPNSLAETARGNRTGFETVISVRSAGPYFVVEALDASGRIIGRSATIKAVVMPDTTSTTTKS